MMLHGYGTWCKVLTMEEVYSSRTLVSASLFKGEGLKMEAVCSSDTL